MVLLPLKPIPVQRTSEQGRRGRAWSGWKSQAERSTRPRKRRWISSASPKGMRKWSSWPSRRLGCLAGCEARRASGPEYGRRVRARKELGVPAMAEPLAGAGRPPNVAAGQAGTDRTMRIEVSRPLGPGPVTSRRPLPVRGATAQGRAVVARPDAAGAVVELVRVMLGRVRGPGQIGRVQGTRQRRPAARTRRWQWQKA